MRLRNIPGSREVIAENRWCVQEPEKQKGQWLSLFGNENPIHIEIGMGKGQFLMACLLYTSPSAEGKVSNALQRTSEVRFSALKLSSKLYTASLVLSYIS